VLHLDTVAADLDQKQYCLAGEVVGDLAATMRWLADADLPKSAWDLDELAARRQQMFARLAPPPGTFGPRAVLAQLRQGRASAWALERLTTIGQACLAVTRDVFARTLGWALERLHFDGWSCERIKAHLALA
jgi:hypothetical protein